MTADGTDTYHLVKNAGRYKECERTQGISATDLIGRMLLMSKEHQQRGQNEYKVSRQDSSEMSSDSHARSPWTGVLGMGMPDPRRRTEKIPLGGRGQVT